MDILEFDRIVVIMGDITKESVDAIVNAANNSLMGGGGVDGAIHRAGGEQILKECREIIKRIGRLNTGEAVITTGGNLKAKYVIHTVGPIWHGGNNGEEELLAKAYRNCLKLAYQKGIKTIAFPSISTGVYGFPKEPAARIAYNTVKECLKEYDTIDEVRFVCFDDYTYKLYLDLVSEYVKK